MNINKIIEKSEKECVKEFDGAYLKDDIKDWHIKELKKVLVEVLEEIPIPNKKIVHPEDMLWILNLEAFREKLLKELNKD